MRVQKSLLLALSLILIAAGFVLARHTPQFPELDTIASDQPNFSILAGRLTSLAEKKGALYAFDILRRAEFPRNIDIHLLAHYIGSVLYKQKGIAGMAYCTDEFHNACSHAIVVSALVEHGLDVLDQVRDACHHAPGGMGAYTMCMHGFGHGVFTYFNDDLEKTVAYCKRTGTPEYHNQEFSECVGGAIMELMGSGGHNPEDLAAARKKYLTKPLQPCMSSIIPDQVKPMCLNYLTSSLWEAAGINRIEPLQSGLMPKAFAYCEKIPTSQAVLRDACYGGFGKEFPALVTGRDIRSLTELDDVQLHIIARSCALAGVDDGRISCSKHVIDTLIWGGEIGPEIAFRYCTVVPDTDKGACFGRIATNLRRYFPVGAQRTGMCARLPEEVRPTCAS